MPAVLERLKTIKKSKTLSDEEKTAIETVLREKRIRDKGGDPDSPFARGDEDEEE